MRPIGELFQYDATRLAALVRARDVSSREVVEAHCANLPARVASPRSSPRRAVPHMRRLHSNPAITAWLGRRCSSWGLLRAQSPTCACPYPCSPAATCAIFAKLLTTGLSVVAPAIYADPWREDLCLGAAEIIEAGVRTSS